MKQYINVILFIFIIICHFSCGNSPNSVHVDKDSGEKIDEGNSLNFINVDNVIGATIDESIIKHIIHVNCGFNTASDTNTGSKEAPLKSIGEAIKRAEKFLNSGTPTKILIYPGTYREGDFNISRDNDKFLKTLLVIEGTEKGKVILSGSDLYTPDSWKKINTKNGIVYEHPWNYDFGHYGGHFGRDNIPHVIGHRSEMIFVNNRMQKQILIEMYEYEIGDYNQESFQKDPKLMTRYKRDASFKDYVLHGKYHYSSYPGPDILEEESFGVAEKNENGNKIFLKIGKDIDFPKAKIEVAVRRKGIFIDNKENLVIRNLTFQHYAGFVAEHVDFCGALRISQWDKKPIRNKNVLIEHCDFLWNNGCGLQIFKVDGLTVRSCGMYYNGGAGSTVAIVNNMLWENIDTSFNNWRGFLGDKTTWFVAGVKFIMVINAIYKDHTSIGNLCSGFWFDIDCDNALIDGLVAVRNLKGFFLETSRNVWFKNGLLADNMNFDFLINNSFNILVEDTIMYRSKNVSKFINKAEEDKDIAVTITIDPMTFAFITYPRTQPNLTKVALGLMKDGQLVQFKQSGPVYIKNSVFASSIPDRKLCGMLISNPLSKEPGKNYSLKGANNIYFSPTKKVFSITHSRNVPPHLYDFKEFSRKYTLENSEWIDPGFVMADNYNYTMKDGNLLKKNIGLPVKKISDEKIKMLEDYTLLIKRISDKDPL